MGGIALINYKQRETIKHNLEMDERAYNTLVKRLEMLKRKYGPAQVKAIQYDLQHSSKIITSDMDDYLEILQVVSEMQDLKEIIEEEKKNIDYYDLWLENFIETTNDTEALVYQEHYCKGKSLYEIAFQTPLSYGYVRQVHMKIKSEIGELGK